MCRVPLGSCLGLLLVLIYINDLPLPLQKSHVSMYVDDTVIFFLHANQLSLNVVKTLSLITCSGPNIHRIARRTDAQPSFPIGDQAIEIITDTRYLGLQIDCQLKCDKHIDTIKTKANRSFGLVKLGMLRNIFHLKRSTESIQGIVEPYLRYCYSVWGCCSESKIMVVQKVQNRAARILASSPYDASPLIQNLGWSTISKLVKQRPRG